MTSFNFLYLSEDNIDNESDDDDDNDDDTVCKPVFCHSNKEPSGNNRRSENRLAPDPHAIGSLVTYSQLSLSS